MRQPLLILLLFILLSPFQGSATKSDKKIDSLKKVLTQTSNKTTRTKTLNKLCWNYRIIGAYDTASTYCEKALRLAKKINNKILEGNALINHGRIYLDQSNYQKAVSYFDKGLRIFNKKQDQAGLAKTFKNLGTVYSEQSKYAKALSYFSKSLEHEKKINNQHGVASCYNSIGIVYGRQSNYAKALENFFNALKIQQKTQNDHGLANTYNNIGGIYFYQQELQKALKYFKKSLKYEKNIGNKKGLASSYNNISIIYKTMNDYINAYKYIQKGLRIRKSIEDQQGVANSYITIASMLIRISDEPDSIKRRFFHKYLHEGMISMSTVPLNQAILDSAKMLFQKASTIHKKLGRKYYLTSSLEGLGNIYMKQGHPTKALRFFRKAYQIADTIKLQNRQHELARQIADAYTAMNQHEKAVYWLKKQITHKDSVFNEKKQKELGRQEARFAWEKKLIKERKEHEKDQLLAKAKSKRQSQVIYAVSGGLVLVMGLLLLLYNRFRLTRKQKSTIAKQKELVDEKNKSITDSINYAKRIQTAILTADDVLQKEAGENYFILFQPKETVSGDFYWAHRVGDKLIWTTVDCTGHGVPGAFMSMIGNQLLNETVIEKKITEADEILNQLREGVIKTLQQKGEEGEMKDGMDLALCVWDRKQNKLQFAGANNPLYLVRKKNNRVPKTSFKRKSEGKSRLLYEIPPTKLPIGYQLRPEDFQKCSLKLQKGDIMYTFSDGYPDQFGGPKGKKFMYKRFRELLLNIQDKPMDKQKRILQQTIEDWMAQNSEEQIDDICVLGVRV